MKKDNRGFMLVEILLVITVIITSMIFLYVQISNMNDTYEETFNYNTVHSIYAMENIKKFLLADGLDKIKTSLNDDNKYLDLSDCNSLYVNNTSYCTMLFDNINVKNVFFTKQDVSKLYDIDFPKEMKKFIKKISYDKTDTYRLIVEYNDGTFSTTKMEV